MASAGQLTTQSPYPITNTQAPDRSRSTTSTPCTCTSRWAIFFIYLMCTYQASSRKGCTSRILLQGLAIKAK